MWEHLEGLIGELARERMASFEPTAERPKLKGYPGRRSDVLQAIGHRAEDRKLIGCVLLESLLVRPADTDAHDTCDRIHGADLALPKREVGTVFHELTH